MPGEARRGDTFDVVPAALRGVAGTFDAEAEALAGAAISLQQHLGALGAPWGTDAVGVRFGAAYQPAADAVSTNLGALADGLERIASALIATANAYELADATLPAVPPLLPVPPAPDPAPTPVVTPASDSTVASHPRRGRSNRTSSLRPRRASAPRTRRTVSADGRTSRTSRTRVSTPRRAPVRGRRGAPSTASSHRQAIVNGPLGGAVSAPRRSIQ